jgi:hypothetical protein
VTGRAGKPTGLSQAEPSFTVSALTGFDPSRCEYCTDESGEQWLPQYGVAPHECYWRKGPQFTLGQSTLVPFTGSDCFVPDLEENEDWSAFKYPSACGIYYCPRCQHEQYSKAWAALIARIGEPPAEVGVCQHG